MTGDPVEVTAKEWKMERNRPQRRRVFVWLTSTLLAASVFAPAAAWAEFIVKPGH